MIANRPEVVTLLGFRNRVVGAELRHRGAADDLQDAVPGFDDQPCETGSRSPGRCDHTNGATGLGAVSGDQAELPGPCDGFGSVGGAELAQEVGYVFLDRVERDH